MGQLQPPSTNSHSPMFLIGKDREGHWVVQDERHLCGGLFVNRTEALKFALFENGNRPHAVIMVPGFLELDMSGHDKSSAPATDAHRLPRAA